MSVSDLVFDPSKKKKKKKKVTIDDDDVKPSALVESGVVNSEINSEASFVSPSGNGNIEGSDVILIKEEVAEVAADDLDLDLNFSNKKKKKTKPVRFELEEETAPSNAAVAINEEETIVPEDELDVDLGLGRKKKKSRGPKVTKEELLKEDEGDSSNLVDKDSEHIHTSHDSSALSCTGIPDYSYDELLRRVFDTIREKNPDMISGEKKRVVMKPPQLMRVGSKKTAFVNLAEISKHLKRQLKHVLQYLLSELGTTGSIDGNSQIILRGRFQSKHIEPLLRNYVKEFVMCHTCRSQDTELMKDTRLVFLNCNTCGSRCSVTSIKSGYQALTGRRAAMRAKTN